MNEGYEINDYTEILLFPGWWDDTPLKGYETDNEGLTQELAEATKSRRVRHSFRDESLAERTLRKSLRNVFALGRAGHPRVHTALVRLRREYVDGRLHLYYRQEGREESFEEEYLRVYYEELARFLKEEILPF